MSKEQRRRNKEQRKKMNDECQGTTNNKAEKRLGEDWNRIFEID
jgi:hypothetical protein